MHPAHAANHPNDGLTAMPAMHAAEPHRHPSSRIFELRTALDSSLSPSTTRWTTKDGIPELISPASSMKRARELSVRIFQDK